jgi:hypothetical protein
MVVLSLGGGPVASQDVEPRSGSSLKEYTDYLLKTFGADATVTDVDISGKTKSGEDFDNTFSAERATRVELLGLAWPGSQCGSRTRCPAGMSLPERYYCQNTQVPNHEVQEDIFVSGPFPWRISQTLDCQVTADRNRMCTTAKTRYCP